MPSTTPLLDSKFNPEEEFQKVQNQFKIDPNNLTKQMAQQPAMYGYYAVRYQILKARVKRLESTLKMVENEMIERFRKQHADAQEKFTEAQLAAEAKSSTEVYQAHKEYYEMLEKFNIMEALVDTLKIRAEMLVSIGYHLKLEQDIAVK